MAKQKDGRYRAKITVGHDADGKPIVKYASGRTKKELEAAKEELIRAYITGNTDARRDVLFGTYAWEWYRTYKEPHLSPSSRHVYISTFDTHLLPVLANRQLRAITAMDLQQLLNGKAGMSVTSIGYITSILRGVFRTATAQGVIDRDPTLALVKPGAEQQTRRALTKAETAAALKVGEAHPEGLLLLILYYTGLRIGEALGLQWGDIDFKAKTVTVRRDLDFRTGEIGKTKTAASDRTVPIPDALFSALHSVRGFGETYIIQGPKSGSYLSRTSYTRMWDRLMAAMYEADSSIEAREGWSGLRSILTPHYFRHNYASVLYNAGVDILSAQRYLGHSNVKTTLQIYAHLGEEKTLESTQKIQDAFAQK